MLERIFSKRYLGHSKIFEQQVRQRLVGILHRYYLTGTELEEEDLLAEVGLVRATNEVNLYGPIKLELRGELLDLAPFRYGVSLGSETLNEAQVIGVGCRRVLSVENKATFRELIRQGMDGGTLLICLGGFAGPIKRKFLNRLGAFSGDLVEYYHWGDLDYGGLQIFRHLQKNCWPRLQPLRMDEETYVAFVKFGEVFSERQGQKLRGLLEKGDFSCFHGVLKAMVEYGRTLEQEAVDVAGI
ncbi:MAG: DUF2220 family protein [Clostridia bacterium]|nr:DUF2220 family protein [Clostridia bacterium]